MVYRYQESHSFHPVILVLFAVLIGVFAYAWMTAPQDGGSPWPPALVGGVLILLPLLFGRLRFTVDENAVTAEFGYLGWPRRRVPLSQIRKARVVQYHPMLQFGGWGIRFGRLEGERTGVYSLRGSGGVLLELEDEMRVCAVRTRRFLLGSTRPEELVRAIGKP